MRSSSKHGASGPAGRSDSGMPDGRLESRRRPGSAGSVVALAGVLWLGLVSSSCGSRATEDADAPAVAQAASSDTLALPAPRPGLTRAEIAGWFGPGAREHRYATQPDLRLESWEWSEPMGRDAQADFVDGRLVRAAVRRPWVDHLPIVQARRLVDLEIGLTRAQVHERLGAGWPVARAYVHFGAAPVESETEGWTIHDRHLQTGRSLFVTYSGGRVVTIEHPWVRR